MRGSLVFLTSLLVLSGCRKSSAGPHACASDDECVIACDAVGDCCSHPWCENVQHRDDAKAAREANDKTCTKKENECPRYGDRPAPPYTIVPRCKAAACVAEKVPR